MEKKEVITKGAEAIVRINKEKGIVIKTRNKKSYRTKKLDERLRKERTRREVRIMKKLEGKLLVPKVLSYSKYSFVMEFVEGRRLNEIEINKEIAKKAGKSLGVLHKNDVVHGDFSRANLILSKKGLYVIDFGLSFISKRIEDKADDLYFALTSFKEFKEDFLKGYGYEEKEKILKRVEEIRKRARYVG